MRFKNMGVGMLLVVALLICAAPKEARAASITTELFAQVWLKGHDYQGIDYPVPVTMPGTTLCLQAETPDAPMPYGATDGIARVTTSAIPTGWQHSDVVSFGELRFTKAGVYRYTITQEAGPYAYLVYDAAPHAATITVTEKNGRLSSSVTYDVAGASAAVLTNRYLAAELTVRCIVDGLSRHRQNPLNVNITSIPGRLGTYPCFIERQTGEQESATLDHGALKTALRDGEKLTIVGLPIGSVYALTSSPGSIQAHFSPDGAGELPMAERATDILAHFERDPAYINLHRPTAREGLLILPNALQIIEANAFAGSAFDAVYCPDGLRAIRANAFARCQKLTKIRIPESVEEIDPLAFAGCREALTIVGLDDSPAEAFALSQGYAFLSEEEASFEEIKNGFELKTNNEVMQIGQNRE